VPNYIKTIRKGWSLSLYDYEAFLTDVYKLNHLSYWLSLIIGISVNHLRRKYIMAGTAKGGRLAAEKNKLKHGSDFYKRIGSLGGHNSHTGGFFANRELARKAGAKGGAISRRN
jgi:general stress protein YciG